MSVDWRIEKHDEVHSTQDIITGVAAMGEPEGKVVVAAAQTGGRGRHGRQWVSEAGNLYLSFLLRPGCSTRVIGQLGLVIGLALGTALRKFVDDPDLVVLKWPNDVLLDGQKCAGILIETELSESSATLVSVAVGMGVNVSSAPVGLGAALNEYAAARVSRDDLLQEILKQVGAHYKAWLTDGFAAIKPAWLAMAYPKKTPMSVKIGPQIQRGVFYDVDDDGNLLLHDSELRLKKITAGEIYIQD